MNHNISNVYTEGDGDEAIVNSYVLVVDEAEKNSTSFMGRYRDLVVKTAAGWRIRQKQIFAG